MAGRIAVLGAGAIGSCVAADLTRAEHDVTVVDQWPAHVEAIRAGGVRIQLPDEELHVELDAHHVCDLATLRRTFDVVLLAAKSPDTRWMTELVRPYLADDGVVVGLQNGMNDDDIAAIVGERRTIGCVVELSAEIFTPGLVQRDTTPQGTWFGLGELDGSRTSRLDELRALLGHAARVDVTDNIRGAKWTKLVVNSMTMGPFGLLGLRNWEAVALPGMLEISVPIGREALAVGDALGYRTEPIFGMTAEEFAGSSDEMLVTGIRTLMAHIGRSSTTASVHDHRKGRRTEMGHINGVVVARGGELGVPTPYNALVMNLYRRVDTGELAMDPANLDLLKEGARVIEAGPR